MSAGSFTEGRLLNVDASGTVLGYAAIAPGSNSADATRCLTEQIDPVPSVGFWGLVLMSLGLGGFAWRRQRSRG